MKTTFSPTRMSFTKRAHLAAREQFYAEMFPGLAIDFEDTVGTTRDLEYAIDCQLAVTTERLRAPLRFAVQERWRTPDAVGFGDVTVTEWNLPTDQPSELHKLGAHLFVYGFYDEATDRVAAAAAIDVPRMLRALALRRLSFHRNSRVDQSFLSFDAGDLRRFGAVVFEVDHYPKEAEGLRAWRRGRRDQPDLSAGD